MKYKLVPVEPTREMVGTLYAVMDECVLLNSNPRDAYAELLAAAPSPEWVPVSERLPTREDADEHEKVWAFVPGESRAWVVCYDSVGTRYDDITHWMPKPRQEPPAPPTSARE